MEDELNRVELDLLMCALLTELDQRMFDSIDKTKPVRKGDDTYNEYMTLHAKLRRLERVAIEEGRFG